MCIQSTKTQDRHPVKQAPPQPSSTADNGTGPPGWIRKPVDRGPEVRLLVNGAAIPAYESEAVGVALAVAGLLTLRRSPGAKEPRGMFCLMSVCQECVVEIDGQMRPSCMTRARDGMRVKTDALQRARGEHRPRADE